MQNHSPSFRELVESVIASSPSEGGNFSYWPIVSNTEAVFGIKMPYDSKLTSTENKEQQRALLASLSSLTIHTDPLEGLTVGQQLAYSNSPLVFRIHSHVQGQHLNPLREKYPSFPQDSATIKRYAEGIRNNIKKVAAISDDNLQDWLEVVMDLDSRGYAADTTGLNLLRSKQMLHWIDVDDPSFSNDSFVKSRGANNHLYAVDYTLQCQLGIVRLLDESKKLTNLTPDTEYTILSVQEEWRKLSNRLTNIAISIGMPLNPMYHYDDPIKEVNPPIIKADMSFDEKADDIFQALHSIHAIKKPSLPYKGK